MAERGQPHGALLVCPLAFDNAISSAAAREGYRLVAGHADIVIAPDLEAATCWPSSSNTSPVPPSVALWSVRGCQSRVGSADRRGPRRSRGRGVGGSGRHIQAHLTHIM